MDPWYDVEYDALHEGAPVFILTAPFPAALALLMAGILLVVGALARKLVWPRFGA